MKIIDIDVWVDMNQYPEFEDAFIESANWEDGAPLTDFELERLNEDTQFVYEQVIKRYF